MSCSVNNAMLLWQLLVVTIYLERKLARVRGTWYALRHELKLRVYHS